VTAHFTAIGSGPDLTIAKMHSGDFNRGDTNRVYAIGVANVGTSSTSGKVYVVDTVPIPGSGPGANDFEESGSCGTLAHNKSCKIKILFDVNHVGFASATLSITDNGSGSPQTVAISGTAIDPKAILNPRSLSFGSSKVNHSTSKTVKLANTGSTPLTLGSSPFSFSGSNAGDFSETDNCPTSLHPDDDCTIAVKVTPKAKGSRSASMKVSDNAYDSPQSVSLTGKGT
jgi:HYDIN/CFA65/VesB-like, Ig-like domain